MRLFLVSQLLIRTVVSCTLFVLGVLLSNQLKAQSKLFNDNIWYFGSAVSGSSGSQGIVFKENSQGIMEPHDASGVAKLDNPKNTLCVSTSTCSDFIFYTSHDKIYNANHEVMHNSDYFEGHKQVADGLACCYMGNNKYALFSVTDDWNKGKLKYYIVDMNGDNGLGSLIVPDDSEIDSGGVCESIELMAIPGTSDKYWLVYHHGETKSMRVVRFTSSGIDYSFSSHSMKYVSYIFPSTLLNNETYSFTLQSRIVTDDIALLALTTPEGVTIHLFSFDLKVGRISYNKTISHSSEGAVYGVEFSPSGEYLYVTEWNNSKIEQFRVSDGQLVGLLDYTQGSVLLNHYGGGMKLGPDGKIYIARGSSDYLAVLTEPDKPMTPLNLIIDGFRTSVRSAYTLELSTGITLPAIDPPGEIIPPAVLPDYATTMTIASITKNVLANDHGNSGDYLYLTNAFFTNPSDINKGTITLDRSAGTVTFTPNPSYSFGDMEEVNITYIAKDNGTPIASCSIGQLYVTVKQAVLSVIIPPPKEFDEGSTISAQVCLPEGVIASAEGVVINLSRGASSTAFVTDYTMPNTVTINAAEPCATFSIELSNDSLIEGDETLAITASADNFTSSSDILTIKDKTVGNIIVELDTSGISEGEAFGTATFTIRFKVEGVNCPDKRVKVEYVLSGTAQKGIHYTISPDSSTAYIEVGQTSTNIVVEAINNFVVEGGRDVIIELKSVSLVD